MELKIKKSELLNILKWPQGVVEKRGTMPILSNILLEAKSNVLSLSATDLEISVVAQGNAEVKMPGRAVVNARNIFEIVKEAPDEFVKLTKKSDHSLEVSSGKARFRVLGMNAEEFPNLPQLASSESEDAIVLDAEEFEEMIQKTFYAASTDETRYTLNGLYLVKAVRGEKSFLRVVATDGHRLSFTEKETDKNWNLAKGIIIPRKGIAEVKSLISGAQGELKVALDEKAIRFQRGPIELTVRLIEGDFPAYEQVIPKKSDKIVSVDRGLLVGALRRAAIMTSEQARGVKFSFSESVLEISSSHPDLGEAVEEIAIDYKDTKFHVGFNPKYFLDLLSILEDEKVVLELKDEVSPCVVRSEYDRGFLALVMPMRI